MASNSNTLTRGVCKWFDEAKGYGFITVPGRANDVFCHFSGISGTGRKNLIKGQNVEFYLEESKVKPGQIVATEVIVVG
jgi:CspA family cold shock protein